MDLDVIRAITGLIIDTLLRYGPNLLLIGDCMLEFLSTDLVLLLVAMNYIFSACLLVSWGIFKWYLYI